MLCFAERSAHSANSEVDGNGTGGSASPLSDITQGCSLGSGKVRSWSCPEYSFDLLIYTVFSSVLVLIQVSWASTSQKSRCISPRRCWLPGEWLSGWSASLWESKCTPDDAPQQTHAAVYHSCAMLIGRNRKPQPAAAAALLRDPSCNTCFVSPAHLL